MRRLIAVTLKKLAFAIGVLTVMGLMGTLVVTPSLAHDPKLINRTLELTMGDLFFQLKGQEKNAPITLKAGETVRLVIKNEGAILHDLHFGKDADLKDRLYKTDLIAGLDMIELDPKQGVKLTITVPKDAGEWEIGCFQPGHYEANMKAKLIVQK